MNQLDRRQWLKTMSLTGSLAFLGGIDVLANTPENTKFPPTRPLKAPIRLNSNENPFGPSKKVRQAMIDNFDLACRYPYSYSDELFDMIARKEGVTKDHLVIAAGSTEGLRITGLTYGVDGGEIIAAEPTFLALLTYAQQFGAYINRVPLDDTFTHDLEEMERRVNSNTRLVFICNPNNPTATILPTAKLKDFCESVSKKAVVFCDEAYIDFVEDPGFESMVQLVKKGQNVIVSKTFSKVYGLAGIRIGYLIARPDITARLNRNLAAFTNVLALKAAQTALQDKEFYEFSLQKNREAKQEIYKTLDGLGFEYVKSHTNFIFFKTGRPIRGLISDMAKEGVKIGRPFPPYLDWCRISTGTMDEVKMFGSALKKVMT